MHISAYSWAGIRTADFAATVRFFAEVLGLPLTLRNDDSEFAHFWLPSGQLFEIFGPKACELQPIGCPVLGFEVEDVGAARQELEVQGVEFVTEVFEMDDGAAWTYFRGPDGYPYELWRPAKEA
jgi:catechol 2,3-dioxygenase-like lactoylglutathione lyase family enzyme